MNRTPTFPLFLRADWNTTASVWIATSEDQPDFVVQAERLEALVKKIERRTAPATTACCVEPPRSCRG